MIISAKTVEVRGPLPRPLGFQVGFETAIIEIEGSCPDQSSFFVVGSTALSAVQEQSTPWERPNGTTPDLDILARLDNHELDILNSKLRAIAKRDPSYPEAHAEPILSEPNPSRFQLLTQTTENNGTWSLHYGEASQEIPEETMQPVPVTSREGIRFPTLPPMTLFFRYLVRGGSVVKPKDEEKLLTFWSFCLENPHLSPKPETYFPYLIFIQTVGQIYPGRQKLFSLYWKLDHALGGFFSGSTGPIHNIKAFFK